MQVSKDLDEGRVEDMQQMNDQNWNLTGMGRVSIRTCDLHSKQYMEVGSEPRSISSNVLQGKVSKFSSPLT